MKYNERYQQLNNCFNMGNDCRVNKSGTDIKFFSFNSYLSNDSENDSFQIKDKSIYENFSFKYPVFIPDSSEKFDKAILLLHGLNERAWNKYLTWAEYLCQNKQVPVIMFPIAYHINRAPISWSNPRKLVDTLSFRKEKYEGDRSISYANIALSDRLSEHPSRFYLSGRQTLLDLTLLFEEIKNGNNSLFKEGTNINIFAYSIGAFLAQIALTANHKELFSDSRLFMFCGGSIFSTMFGVSRSILDTASFNQLQNYYINIFGNEPDSIWKRDNIFEAFRRMITPDKFKDERERAFTQIKNKIKGIALSRDIVIPYLGVQQALGHDNATETIQLKDFSYNYTHENPFPYNEKDTTSLNNSFEEVFSSAISFL